MKWKLVADSGSTITSLPLNEDTVFELVPLMINIGTEVFIDDAQLDIPSFIQTMHDSQATSSTACPSPNAYAQAFEGAENVLCFTLSSGLSGSYNSAMLGRDLLLEQNPTAKVHVFDTLSAGTEMDILVYKAAELINAGLGFEQVIDGVNDYAKKTAINFILENVENLVKNGRINKIVGSMIGLLGIRLIGVATPEGKIDIATKSKGTKRAVKSVVEQMLSRGYQGGKVRISHSHNLEAVEMVEKALQQHYPDVQVEVVEMNGLCSFYAQDGGLILGYEIA